MENVIEPVELDMVGKIYEVVSMIDKALILLCSWMSVEDVVEEAFVKPP